MESSELTFSDKDSDLHIQETSLPQLHKAQKCCFLWLSPSTWIKTWGYFQITGFISKQHTTLAPTVCRYKLMNLYKRAEVRLGQHTNPKVGPGNEASLPLGIFSYPPAIRLLVMYEQDFTFLWHCRKRQRQKTKYLNEKGPNSSFSPQLAESQKHSISLQLLLNSG